MCPTIDVSEEVKKHLQQIKDDYGCKTYNEAINLTLLSEEAFDIIKKIANSFTDKDINVEDILNDYICVRDKRHELLKQQ